MKRDRLFIVQMTGNKRTKFTFDHDGSVIWNQSQERKRKSFSWVNVFPPNHARTCFKRKLIWTRSHTRAPGPTHAGPHVRLPAGTGRQEPAPTQLGAPDAQRATKSASLRLCCVGALTHQAPRAPRAPGQPAVFQSASCAVHCVRA